MKRFLLSLIALVMLAGSANAQVDIFYSTSNTDSNAGTSLDLNLGDTGSIFVWVANNDAAAMDGLGIDMLSSDAAILEAFAHTINDPGGRWLNSNPGDLGDLATNTVSIALIGLSGTGIANDGNAVLHSEIQFDATAIGSTTLSIAENANAISISGNAPQSINFGTASVNVINAVPEPSSLMVIGALAIGTIVRRRRSA